MYDLVIIGGGPGGYAAALYAHNFGLSVALVEKDLVGGTCLHRGCVPTKAWLETAEVFAAVAGAGEFGVVAPAPGLEWGRARERKDRIVGQLHRGLGGLLRQRGVETVAGTGRLALPGGVVVSTGEGERRLEGRAIILATGAVPRSIPGYDFDGERIVSSDHALDWTERPGRVAVVGAGAIGCEFASFLSDLGSEVHLFEVMEQIVPGMEPEAARVLHRELASRRVEIRTGTAVGPATSGPDGMVVPFDGGAATVDVVLVAVGRAPVTAGLGLEGTRVEVERGFVKVDPATQETGEPGIFAVGDIVAGTPQLAHAGFAEGIAAVTYIATGRPAPVDYRAVPAIVYTRPEVAAVGLTEERARAAGYEVATHSHGFQAASRAMIQGENRGLVKVVSEVGGPILGATIAGPAAGELIHEMVLAVGWEALPAEAAAFIHGHPTLAEVLGETLMSSAGRSLH
ncbi:MAG: dihydrolipoyl dehydrogenase [Actinobacteria bacterium]|nr:dihydrolipoyl dehydrogenase [Actinomycetota bacterium]